MKWSRKIEQHYTDQFKKYELTWSPYFHYGIFRGDTSLVESQEYTLNLIVEKARIVATTQVLDVGAGIGSSCIYVADRYGCPIRGIDPVEECLNYARKRLPTHLQNQVTFTVGSAENLPLKGCLFDAIISNEVFCHIADKRKVFSECHRILKPNGYLVFSDLFDKVGGEQTKPFHEYLKNIIPMLKLDQYKEAICSFFRLVEIRDYSDELPKNYEKALGVLETNKTEILQKFGEDEFNFTKAFYELCLTSPIKNGIGWGIFVCRKKGP